LLVDTHGVVDYQLRFGRDANRRALVWLDVRARLSLSCQRCLGVLEFPVDAQTTLVLVQGLDEAAGLPDDYDPLLPSEPLLRPMQLIEDELLLAIPTIPRHDAQDCLDLEAVLPPPEPEPEPKAANPFAELTNLKQSAHRH
jgi:uncharacterized protein